MKCYRMIRDNAVNIISQYTILLTRFICIYFICLENNMHLYTSPNITPNV